MNVTLTNYHIICDTYLGFIIYAIIRTPYACIEWINDMYLQWYPYIVPNDQTRYSSVEKWKCYPILGKHDDRVIMYFFNIITYEE